VEMDCLRDDQPDAYKLLCRMGCYRYQDVKTVSFEGLICLLWDVPKSQQAWVVEYLCKSPLIEAKCEYYLHPSIREYAKCQLLKHKEDWEISNRHAAIFWSDSVLSVESFDLAMKALESTRHYLAINDFESAASEMSKRRQNKWYSYKDGEYLVNSVERLGLSLEIVSYLQMIVHNIPPSQTLIKLYQVLGTHYCLNGDINMGISSYQKLKEISEIIKCLDYQIIGLIMIGIANLSTFEIDNADKSFTHALN